MEKKFNKVIEVIIQIICAPFIILFAVIMILLALVLCILLLPIGILCLPFYLIFKKEIIININKSASNDQESTTVS